MIKTIVEKNNVNKIKKLPSTQWKLDEVSIQEHKQKINTLICDAAEH